ncbi:MAG: biotin-dependent carboxyltransferase family protein [Ferruginibacter sp.]
MSIKIIKPGIFSTIQDGGRTGHRSQGIGPGGTMDYFAAAIANYMAGNDNNAPIIEMHFPAAEIFFDTDTIISIAGADFDAHINDMPVELYKPVIIQKNSVLSFKKIISGARVYLAIHGGLQAEKWLGSYSTNTKVNAGGHLGRPLKKDDVIEIPAEPKAIDRKFFLVEPKSLTRVYENTGTIRCVKGPEWELMDEPAKQVFLSHSFTVSSQSDRMGYRLAGENILLNDTASLVSSPVNSGTIQVLPGGQLIVLMADHQTTGGYPRLANIITADLPKLAQLPVNAKLNFELVSLQQAEDAFMSAQHLLAVVKTTCQKLYGDY